MSVSHEDIEVPFYNESKKLFPYLLKGEDALVEFIDSAMTSKDIFSLSQNDVRRIECILFCIFYINNPKSLSRALNALDAENVLFVPFFLSLDKLSQDDRNFNEKVATFDGIKCLEGIELLKLTNTNVHKLLYYRDEHMGAKDYPSLSFLFGSAFKEISLWNKTYELGIAEDNINLLEFLYTINEYHFALMSKSLLEQAITHKSYKAIRWIVEKGIDVEIENNPFKMINSKSDQERARGIKFIIESRLDNVIPFIKDRRDINNLLELKNVALMDIFEQAKDVSVLEIAMDN